MKFNARRSSVLSRNGMVATSQPLAVATGIKVLMEGGNAIDAAVATAATLNVVEPMSTGIGGDLFALVWMDNDKKVRALNGSGRSSSEASLDQLLQQGLEAIPATSPFAVTVPGTVDAWHSLLQHYGSMSLSHVLKPAIRYAEEGYPVSHIIAKQWASGFDRLSRHNSGKEFLLNGSSPKEGEIIKLPELARTLHTIAEGGAEAFYRGEIAENTAVYIQELGGWLTTDDMAGHASTWDTPINTEYQGVTCWQCPPNGSGVAVLMALNIAEHFDIRGMGLQHANAYHHLIESMRLSYADTLRHVADPMMTPVPVTELISKNYARDRASLINTSKAMAEIPLGNLKYGDDTVYVTVVDGDGNACSLINSLYQGFGTGLVVPGTGIILQNRGALFSLDPEHPNSLGPGKRPYHTIIPGMATRGEELWLSYGVMGGFQQPQGQLQLLVNMIDFDLDPQEALNVLRFSINLNNGVAVEEGLPRRTFQQLKGLGHDLHLVTGYDRMMFGGGQVIERDPQTGSLRGGSEPRKDGCVMGW